MGGGGGHRGTVAGAVKRGRDGVREMAVVKVVKKRGCAEQTSAEVSDGWGAGLGGGHHTHAGNAQRQGGEAPPSQQAVKTQQEAGAGAAETRIPASRGAGAGSCPHFHLMYLKWAEEEARWGDGGVLVKE